ncbi:hypothetical protein L1887_53605 [Cichorium endivia]|nr:hypothetical protein L1887_53605 [Cichorium endivia]
MAYSSHRARLAHGWYRKLQHNLCRPASQACTCTVILSFGCSFWPAKRALSSHALRLHVPCHAVLVELVRSCARAEAKRVDYDVTKKWRAKDWTVTKRGVRMGELVPDAPARTCAG